MFGNTIQFILNNETPKKSRKGIDFRGNSRLSMFYYNIILRCLGPIQIILNNETPKMSRKGIGFRGNSRFSMF